MPSLGPHSILIQVDGDKVYLLDSNYFLIKLNKCDFGKNIQKYLGLYFSTAKKMKDEVINFHVPGFKPSPLGGIGFSI